MKKGQVTIFIIFSILIVLLILFYFAIREGKQFGVTAEENPKAFVQSCAREAVEISIERVLAGGGVANPEKTTLYLGEEYNYLCYYSGNYLSCYNRYPMLEKTAEDEIVLDSSLAIEECFDLMKEELEEKGYSVMLGDLDFQIDIVPGGVESNILRDAEIVKGDSSIMVENFNFKINSPLYELIRVAYETVNGEADSCYFDYVGYMISNPEYRITRVDHSFDKIYKVTDLLTDVEFKFAVRTCVNPPGTE